MPVLSTIARYLIQHASGGNGLKIALAIAALYTYQYRSHAVGSRRRRDLKQPKGAVPLLGHMLLLGSVPGSELYQFFEKQNNDLGPVWSISLPGVGRIIQIDTPENVEHVLKTNFWNYEKGAVFKGMMADVTGNGIFVSDGAEWRFQRKISSNIFSIRAFREYTSDVFVVEGKKVMERLGKAADNGTVIDFQVLMCHFTLDSFGTISFGESFGCLGDVNHEVPFEVSLKDLLEICSERLKDPAWKIREYLTGVSKKVQYDKSVIRTYGLEIIERRRKEGYHASRKDLLQLFMEAKDEDGQPLSDELLIDIILNFTVAGRDTTSQALTWMLYLLYRDESDKSIVEKLIQEVDDVLQGSDPTYETYKQQKYAEACFHEALRIFPTVPRNQKVCLKDDVLPDGTKVHAGEWVSWSPYVMGRSELVWGPDAKEFKPSRWIESEKPSQGKFNAFHAGPRACLGQNFATIEALTLIGLMFQSFEFKLEEPSKVAKYCASLSLPMHEGLKVRLYEY
ncbi:hypothetical protein BGX26_003931 [Mortierella sp. AD094]|nr:hypothetical protein BGX26_003931 [Mortierella sp. AD094]